MANVLNSIWNWFSTDAGAIGILFTILTAFWTALRTLAKRRAELRQERLKIFHQLIKWLVAPDETGNTWQDCQVGIIYELRNIPEYFEPSLRILSGLRVTWGALPIIEKRLKDELDATIMEIERKSKTTRHRIRQWYRDFSTY